jgi:hypothetical protein
MHSPARSKGLAICTRPERSLDACRRATDIAAR